MEEAGGETDREFAKLFGKDKVLFVKYVCSGRV